MSTSLPRVDQSLAMLVGGFALERGSEWLGRQIESRATQAGLPITNVGEIVHGLTPSFLSNVFRILGAHVNNLESRLEAQANQCFGTTLTSRVIIPLYEELFCAGAHTVLDLSLKAMLSNKEVSMDPTVVLVARKCLSIHAVAYLFTMSQGPVDTAEGSRAYARSLIRGGLYAIGGLNGLGIAVGLNASFGFLKDHGWL